MPAKSQLCWALALLVATTLLPGNVGATTQARALLEPGKSSAPQELKPDDGSSADSSTSKQSMVVGGDCASRGPANLAACCKEKPSDPACKQTPVTPVVGGDCASRGPANLAECCKEKPSDPSCKPTPVIPGSDCASRGPANLEACCKEKPNDPACPKPKPPTPVVGSTCETTGPSNWWKCCTDKAKAGTKDSTCPPSQCGLLPSADAAACCASKGYQNDKTCPSPTPAVVVNAVCYDYDKTLQKMKDIQKNSTDYMAQYSDAGTLKAIGVYGEQQMIDLIAGKSTAV